MKKARKSLALILSLVMVMSSCVLFSSASEDASIYVPDYDTDTPVILVHGMSQNNTYVLDENGDRIPKGETYEMGWPLQIDVGALIKAALPNLLMAIFTRKDSGLADAMFKAAHDALPNIHKDNEGNYIKNVEVPCYEVPMSELPAEVKEEYYKFLPVQELGEIVGEDDVYYFGYDSLGDVQKETQKLHHYIHDVVLPKPALSRLSSATSASAAQSLSTTSTNSPRITSL